MVVRVKIKKDDYGMDYVFTIQGVDFSDASGYSSNLYVWKGGTVLVNGGSCTAILSGSDTEVTYTVTDGDFDTVGVWNAEIEFTKTGFKESTETFEWEVLESGG